MLFGSSGFPRISLVLSFYPAGRSSCCSRKPITRTYLISASLEREKAETDADWRGRGGGRYPTRDLRIFRRIINTSSGTAGSAGAVLTSDLHDLRGGAPFEGIMGPRDFVENSRRVYLRFTTSVFIIGSTVDSRERGRPAQGSVFRFMESFLFRQKINSIYVEASVGFR